jgi:hypothetical protein
MQENKQKRLPESSKSSFGSKLRGIFSFIFLHLVKKENLVFPIMFSQNGEFSATSNKKGMKKGRI